MNKNDFIAAQSHYSLTPAEALTQLRQLQEMSQRELSLATGIPQSNISAMENGTSRIGRERAIKLAVALKVHPAVILFPDFDTSQVA